jgi:hypothetical protein
MRRGARHSKASNARAYRTTKTLAFIGTSSGYLTLTFLCLYHLVTRPRPPPTPSPPLHPLIATSAIGQPEASHAMLPKGFVHNMALLLFMLTTSVATTALDVNAHGCKNCFRYLVGAVQLTDLQLLSLIATNLSPTLLVATQQREPLTVPTSLTSALRCVASILRYGDETANDTQVNRRG